MPKRHLKKIRKHSKTPSEKKSKKTLKRHLTKFEKNALNAILRKIEGGGKFGNFF